MYSCYYGYTMVVNDNVQCSVHIGVSWHSYRDSNDDDVTWSPHCPQQLHVNRSHDPIDFNKHYYFS